MSTTLLCGFEMGSLKEANASTGTSLSISSTVKRSGGFSLRMLNPPTTSEFLTFKIINAGATLAAFCQSIRFWLRIDALPTTSSSVNLFTSGSGTSAGTQLALGNPGVLVITDGTGFGGASALALTADGLWHKIVVDASGTSRSVYVDGVLWKTAPGIGAASAQTSFVLGNTTNGQATSCDIYFDDVLVDNGSFGGAGPADSHTLLLVPTAGNNAGSWTDGAGGTGDIHGSVDNIPPVGVAANTAAAKIKNAASGTALDYVATMQTYTAAGLPAGATVNAVQAICNDGEEVATGTKSGGIWVASNPAQSAVVIGAGVGFDYGDDGGALGTFPTGWTTHFGVVASAPTVTLGTAPTMTVRKGSSTTRVVDVDFMGVYVDYTSGTIFTQSFSASTATMSATLSRVGRKVLPAASMAVFAATSSRGIARSVSASMATMAGSLAKQTQRALTASSATMAGALSSIHQHFVTLTASTATMAGAITRQAGKSLTASIATMAGVISKLIKKVFTAS